MKWRTCLCNIWTVGIPGGTSHTSLLFSFQWLPFLPNLILWKVGLLPCPPLLIHRLLSDERKSLLDFSSHIPNSSHPPTKVLCFRRRLDTVSTEILPSHGFTTNVPGWVYVRIISNIHCLEVFSGRSIDLRSEDYYSMEGLLFRWKRPLGCYSFHYMFQDEQK